MIVLLLFLPHWTWPEKDVPIRDENTSGFDGQVCAQAKSGEYKVIKTNKRSHKNK